jgi:rare lipoprotein A
MRRLLPALAVLAAGCAVHKPSPAPAPHYVLGQPYQAGGVWFYPRESDQSDETGIATVYGAGHAALTADGEAYDPTALAAAHPTLPLPSIVRLTNLETGWQVLVRVNDRGPPTPHRVVAVTRRTAQLLGMPGDGEADGVARVRLQVLPAESRAAEDSLPGAPRLAMETAPRDAIAVTALPPPGEAPGASGAASAALAPLVIQPGAADPPPAPPLKLPEQVWQSAPDPGTLCVRLDTFQGHQYAVMQQAVVAGLGARIANSVEGRVRTYRVIIGPLVSVAQADAVLDQVIRAGIMDARIVVE